VGDPHPALQFSIAPATMKNARARRAWSI